MDEDAAWARIVAAFGEEPDAGAGPWPPAEDLRDDERHDGGPRAPRPGPRDYEIPSDAPVGSGDDEHFVPPEPPALPQADLTTTFAWIAVLGGPLLLLAFVLLQRPLTWWASVLGVGGFVGGFATLVARMRDRDEDDDPHGGAVV
jgi:hypothetical protein